MRTTYELLKLTQSDNYMQHFNDPDDRTRITQLLRHGLLVKKALGIIEYYEITNLGKAYIKMKERRDLSKA